MAINNVIEQTINYEVYAEGNRYLGTASVDLPEFNYLSNEIKGAGVAGQIDVPTLGHIENLEITLHWRSIFERPLYLLDQDAVMLSLRGAMQQYDAATGTHKVVPLRIDVRALSSGATLGKLEPSEQTDTESKFNLDYIKISVNGSAIVEHDKFNYVHVVNGRDIMKDVRSALGL